MHAFVHASLNTGVISQWIPIFQYREPLSQRNSCGTFYTRLRKKGLLYVVYSVTVALHSTHTVKLRSSVVSRMLATVRSCNLWRPKSQGCATACGLWIDAAVRSRFRVQCMEKALEHLDLIFQFTSTVSSIDVVQLHSTLENQDGKPAQFDFDIIPLKF